MPNEYFNSSSVPVNGAPGSAATVRLEFGLIKAAFDKLPAMAGKAGEIVVVNGTGTALENSTYKISDFVTLAAPGVLPALDGRLLTNLNAAQFGTVAISGGGTGAITLAGAQAALEIDQKANSLNATLTGAPVAPTPAPADNSTRVATTAYVTTAVAAASYAAGAVVPGTALPLINGASALAGTAPAVSHEDHVHPRDTTKANTASPTFTGVVTLPVVAAADNSTAAASTAWVRTYATGLAIPTSQVTGLDTALGLKAPLAAPTFTGAVNIPTLTLGDNSTKAVNSAYLESWKTTLPGGVSVSNTLALINGTVSAGVSPDASRVDHVHPTDTSRQAALTGAATTIATSNLAASMALVSDADGKVASHGTVSATELGYLDGVTSAVQTQLNAKQVGHANLTAESGLTGAADKLAYYTGVGAKSLTDFLAWGRSFLAAADVAAARAVLGVSVAIPLDAWPVGSVFIAVVATNPASLLGGGTWVAFGTGRTLVGIDAAQAEFNTAEGTGGAKTHTLSTAELPAHTHSLAILVDGGGSGSGLYSSSSMTSTAQSTQNSNSTGSGGAHNNLQPYIVVYFWKRTA